MREPTWYAQRLINALRKLGVHLNSEKYDGNKHIDIVIPSSRIDIEVDGRQHITDSGQVLSDLKRSHYSHEKGYDTLHVTNHDVYENVGGMASAIAEASAVREEELEEKGINH